MTGHSFGRRLWLFLAALLAPLAPAWSQAPIQAELDAPFLHEGSGITVPARIGDYSRIGVTDFTQEQLNIAIQLRDDPRDTNVTVFIYRAATPNLSIWGDRAVIAMSNSGPIGSAVKGTLFLGRFTPPNASGTDSALHARMLVEGKSSRSTGLSLFGHDDWIVKVRATSDTYSDVELTAVIGSIISGLAMKKSKATYPPLTLIEPCKKPMKFSKKATLRRMDLVGQLVTGTAVLETRVAEAGADDVQEPWCRDPQSSIDYGIYRKGDDKRSAMIALSDAGSGAFVTKMSSPSVFGGRLRGYLVKTSDGITEKAWPLLDKPPHPALIKQAYTSVSPIAEQDVRPGSLGGSNIRVTMPE